MAKIDKEYHKLLEKILQEGYIYEDPNRKGVNRLEIPSYTFRHEFKNGFPAITTKKLHYKNVVTELIWFLRGDTNIKYLVDNGCNIWNKDAYNYYLKQCEKLNIQPLSINNFIIDVKENKYLRPRDINYKLGDLGPVYGKQWRNWNTIKSKIITGTPLKARHTVQLDQIKRLIINLKEKPLATDHIVNSWNVGDLPDMALPPCHYGFQIVVRPLTYNERLELLKNLDLVKESRFNNYPNDKVIELCNSYKIPKYGFELHWSQRSVDTFLGLPYNIASYATLALILEKITGYKALAIESPLKKVHLYDNSLDAVKEQLSRDVDKYNNVDLLFKDEFHYITDKELVGEVSLDKILSEMKSDWFVLENYESYPVINVEMLERDD